MGQWPLWENIVKTARDSNINLLALLNDRQEAIHEINDLKGKVHDIEHRVKRQIIKDGDVDLLSVNWTKIRRRNHR